jgi:hypothetical protein
MSESLEDGDEIDGQISGKWVNVKSLFAKGGGTLRGGSTAKTLATTGNTVGSMAITGASLGTGTSSLAVAGAIAAGAAVSATGVGLVVVGGVLTLASMATSGAAMVKSAATVTHLKKIQANLGKFQTCSCMGPGGMSAEMAHDHQWIGRKVLPYIISQKTEKAVKKGVGMVPGASLLTNVYRLGRFAFKQDRGKKRGFYAYVLTRHLVTHDCMLAGAIVGELFSPSEMLTIRTYDTDASSMVNATKMKSI